MLNGGGPADGQSNRNMILAVVLSLLLVVPYYVLIVAPMEKKRADALKAAAPQTQTLPGAAAPAAPTISPAAAAPVATTAPAPSTQPTPPAAPAARIPISTPTMDGFLTLDGQINELSLKNYHETVDPKSPEVHVLLPEGADIATYAVFGWADENKQSGIEWSAAPGQTLSPQSPVTLVYDGGDGFKITRKISVDDRYMFTVADHVENKSATPRKIMPFASVRRHGEPERAVNVHQGFTGALGKGKDADLFEVNYKEARDGKGKAPQMNVGVASTGGWLGVTDKYWLAAVSPDPSLHITGQYQVTPGQKPLYYASYFGDLRDLPTGSAADVTHRFFAGPKVASMLRDYSKTLNIPKFDVAVDWGLLYFITRPIYGLLQFFAGIVGNFGVAILMTTVIVKLALFPIAYNAQKTTSKMQKLQPKLKEIQEKYASDPQRAQQETMRLYQSEKVNLASGCLPVLLQIPIFLALYKTLSVAIEMRHAPFFGWVKDLSAPDPTAWANLFGLLHFNPLTVPLIGGVLAIGVWPLLYGVTMWANMSMTPTQMTDPVQKRIFQLMPAVFTLMFAHFPVGMVIYWTWSNILTIVQQYVIQRRQGVETGFDKWLARLMNRTAEPAKGQQTG